MSTGIEKEIIDVGDMEATNETLITGRKLLKTHIEKDKNIESDYNYDDIERENHDYISESESDTESDVSESDSELSTTDDIFAFDSDQSDSDDEMNNIVDRNYIYHDNIKKSEELPNANTYLKHVSSCTRLHIIQKKDFLNLKKKDLLHFFIYLYVNYFFLTVYICGPIVI